MIIKSEDCLGCGQCIEYCIFDAIRYIITSGYARAEIIQENCKNCGACLNSGCPGDAIIIRHAERGIKIE